jgi:hypothetical protein
MWLEERGRKTNPQSRWTTRYLAKEQKLLVGLLTFVYMNRITTYGDVFLVLIEEIPANPSIFSHNAQNNELTRQLSSGYIG